MNQSRTQVDPARTRAWEVMAYTPSEAARASPRRWVSRDFSGLQARGTCVERLND